MPLPLWPINKNRFLRTIYYILIFLVILGCSAKSTNNRVDIKIIYSNPNDFITKNIDYLTDNYQKYFGRVINEIGVIKFEIQETEEIIIEDTKIWGLRISAIGKPDWSYCEKFILISSHGEILFDRDFRQIEKDLKIPECGMPNYYFDTLETIILGNDELFKSQIKEYYEPCGGQDEITTITMYLYSIENFSLIDSIEVYYKFSNWGDNEITRKSKIKIDDDILTVIKEEYLADKLVDKTETNYKLIDNKLLKNN